MKDKVAVNVKKLKTVKAVRPATTFVSVQVTGFFEAVHESGFMVYQVAALRVQAHVDQDRKRKQKEPSPGNWKSVVVRHWVGSKPAPADVLVMALAHF